MFIERYARHFWLDLAKGLANGDNLIRSVARLTYVVPLSDLIFTICGQFFCFNIVKTERNPEVIDTEIINGGAGANRNNFERFSHEFSVWQTAAIVIRNGFGMEFCWYRRFKPPLANMLALCIRISGI